MGCESYERERDVITKKGLLYCINLGCGYKGRDETLRMWDRNDQRLVCEGYPHLTN